MKQNRASSLQLLAGELVEVRSKEEILATLDKGGRLDGMCFMPEMFAYCTRRFRVFKRAHKTCDTLTLTGGRRVDDAVHLEGVRCDGADHGGCEAACLIFWKEAWLKRCEDPISHESGRSQGVPSAMSPTVGCTEEDVRAAATTSNIAIERETIYSCQATRLLEASAPLPWWDVRQYAEDYRSGNVDAKTVLNGAAYSFSSKVVGLAQRVGRRIGVDLATHAIRIYDAIQRLIGGQPFPRRTGTIPIGQKTPTLSLDLRPGELVRVKSHRQILETLDNTNKNRGLYFDAEHVPYCGGTYHVRSRVNQIIDERTGKMMRFGSASVILEDVYCMARYSYDRMFCPRAIYPYWREIWLERVGDGPSDLDAKPLSMPLSISEKESP